MRIKVCVTTAAVLFAVASCKRTSPCPGTFGELAALKTSAGPSACVCAASASTGAVWGSGTYTTDSSICAAAVHAGAVPVTGGTVTLEPAAGCAGYTGSTANGVTSSPWAAFGTSFYFVGHGAGKCPAIDPNACPATFKEIPDATALTDFACNCAAKPAGSVWGNGIYTTDSSICAAAVHSGAVPATGGKVALRRAPGCVSYSGTAQHGITSAPWPSYDSSFIFPGHGVGKCEAGDHLTCPARFADFPDESTAPEHACTCAAGAAGSVWGDGPYTRDSVLCAAAVHAGAIPPSGGKIVVKPAPGCQAYKGTIKNGVTTTAFGPYEGSFYFPSKGSAKCE